MKDHKVSTAINHEALENATPAVRAYYDDRRLMYRNVVWYMFGGAAGAFGFNTVQSLMPMHMAKIGMDPEQISFALSIRSWVYMFLVLYIAHVSDHWQSRWGRRLPFLLLSLPFLVVGMAVFPWLQSVLPCVIVFAVFSFFVGVKYDTYPLLSYDLVRHKYWGRLAGLGGLAGGAAIWMGQKFLMPMIDRRGEGVVYSLAALFLLVATLLTLIFVREPPLRAKEPPRLNPFPVIAGTLKVGFRKPENALLFVAFVLAISPSLVLNYLSLQGQVNLGLSQGEVGSDLLQWGTLASMLLAPLFGVCVDRFGAVRTCVLGYGCGLLACWFGYHPKTVHELVVASVLVTISSGILYGAATIFVASGIERENIATFCACNGAVTHAFTAALLPLCGMLIKRVFNGNYGSVFLMAAILSTAGLPALIWLDQRRRKSANGITPILQSVKAVA